MWYHNNIKRHIVNMRILFMWFAEKRTFVGCPQMGKITPEVIEWSKKIR
jgi:hypothetical protein